MPEDLPARGAVDLEQVEQVVVGRFQTQHGFETMGKKAASVAAKPANGRRACRSIVYRVAGPYQAGRTRSNPSQASLDKGWAGVKIFKLLSKLPNLENGGVAMKRKSVKRLLLEKETLSRLALSEVKGAVGTSYLVCTASCSMSCGGENCEYHTFSGGTDCCQ